ncbi:hypothetical protein SAMN02745181_0460 [Rubritalea squalenifaciens DSM 18772]|uniref:Uncharacterized protein n=1 Tax=Rubritalea squalenifaciens DSM 18772 TaxID=1123071 RepID=A0A1M6CEN1_9BACT|nr:hypothetical protein [Rubritalea squalenifaciens]SHI59452.1 hypothetical protein SAMN02745181_0460 [Rubritalea squalenifaciens DSM 18772]
MKNLLTFCLLLLSLLPIHAGQDEAITKFYQKLQQHRISKDIQYKGPASVAIRKLLHEVGAEKLGITRVRFDHLIIPEPLQQEAGGFAEGEPKLREIELHFTTGVPAHQVMDQITRQCGWHVAEIKDGILVINTRYRPDAEDTPQPQ